MPEPASWELMEWLKSRIELIRVDAGYHTDLGAVPVVLDDDEVEDTAAQPATLVEALTIDPTSQSTRTLSSDIAVVINFAVPRGDGSTNPKRQIHRARADLVRALKVRDRDLPRFLHTIEVGTAVLGSTDPDENGVSLVLGQLDVRAGLIELE